MLFRRDAELAQVGFSPCVNRIDGGAEVICILSVAFATREYSSFRKRFNRREDRTQIAKHNHVCIETQVMLRIDHAGSSLPCSSDSGPHETGK